MKKSSTAAVKASKKISQLDEAGAILLKQRLSTTPKALREVFGRIPRSRIAPKTGMHSPWVSRLLSELGHEVMVAPARNVRLIGKRPRATASAYCPSQ